MRIVDVVPSGLAEFLRGGTEKSGEDLVTRQLSRTLDDHYVLLRHLTLPESNEQLGMVLVGPAGIWHLDLLHLSSLVKNGTYWVHWDQVQGAVQLVPLGEISTKARSRLAELRAVLAPHGLNAYQAVMVAALNVPRDFSVQSVERMLFVEDLEKFIDEEMPQLAPGEPVNVQRAVDVLTGKVKPPDSETAPAKARGPSWFQTRNPRAGNLTGMQLTVLIAAVLFNCCLLAAFVYVLFGNR
ncbi:MAG: NERD domain-containing protein [Anaerolineales bacterium]